MRKDEPHPRDSAITLPERNALAGAYLVCVLLDATLAVVSTGWTSLAKLSAGVSLVALAASPFALGLGLAGRLRPRWPFVSVAGFELALFGVGLAVLLTQPDAELVDHWIPTLNVALNTPLLLLSGCALVVYLRQTRASHVGARTLMARIAAASPALILGGTLWAQELAGSSWAAQNAPWLMRVGTGDPHAILPLAGAAFCLLVTLRPENTTQRVQGMIGTVLNVVLFAAWLLFGE